MQFSHLAPATANQWSDAQLLARMAANDVDAFEQIFRQYYSALCAHAATNFGNSCDAEDAVADVFARIWEKRQIIQIDSSLKSYLYRAVTNQCIDVLRKAYHRKVSLAEDLGGFDRADKTNVAEETAARELGKTLETAIRRLPKQCGIIYRLSRDAGMKYHEIATHLGLSIKTVETQMGRAFKQVRAAIQAHELAA